MAQPQMLQVKLSRFDAQPWGFRLQGGVDFAAPLLVQKVNGGSLAEKAGLQPGDAVLKINDVDVYNLRHKDAQDIVVRSGNNFVITVQRGGSTWRPHVQVTGQLPQPQSSPYLQTVTKTSLAHKQQESQHIGCGYNNSARPFTNGGDGTVKSLVNKQYNSPVGIYSDESIAETLSAQAEVLAGGVLGVNFKKNEKEYQADKSEVLKFLREEETGTSTPVSSHPYQEQQHQAPPSATRHVNAPINTPKPPSTGGLPAGQNICAECERLITGVFVRIKDRNLHVECFKCATCGTSLKNQGYYCFNNKLYCEIHAKLAAIQNPPPGTDGYVPVPIKPNTKLSANTVSSALSAHGYGNGIPNGSSTPTPAPVANPSTLTTQDKNNSTNNNNNYNYNYNNKNNSNSNISNVSDSITNTTTQSYSVNNSNNLNKDTMATTTASDDALPTGGDQPFEYVTLTGNVIRSVAAPGKGTNINYKVNQGYVRPFGITPSQPPSAAPKSPISYPPQTQQWSAPAPQPKPASSPYATLPRTSVGQQASVFSNNPANNNKTSTVSPNKSFVNVPNATDKNDLKSPALNSMPAPSEDPTQMLTDSISNIKMGTKTNNFMAEAGKIISNMLEARLANNSNAGSPLMSPNLRPNKGSNTTSPMVMRRRFDLDDFKNVDPTAPNTLKPVIAVHINGQKQQPQAVRGTTLPLSVDVSENHQNNHPMGKVLGLCDKKDKQLLSSPTRTQANGRSVSEIKEQIAQTLSLPKSPVISQKPQVKSEDEGGLSPKQTVVYRNQASDANNRVGREGAISTHAFDRRSYIDSGAQANKPNNAPEVIVKALGGPKANLNAPLSPENEEVVNQLLKDGKRPSCCQCNKEIIKGPFITALGRIWCPEHFICVNGNCRRPLQDIGFVEEKSDLYCEYCFEKYLAPTCSKCGSKIKGDCLNAIGRQFHPECFSCAHCGKIFGNTPFFLEDGNPYCEADWNELFTTKCFACGFPVEAGDRWVEALNHNYHSQCFNCTYCKQNLEGQSFYNKGGRPFCKNHAR